MDAISLLVGFAFGGVLMGVLLVWTWKPLLRHTFEQGMHCERQRRAQQDAMQQVERRRV